jgi:integrase/recombinase XerD
MHSEFSKYLEQLLKQDVPRAKYTLSRRHLGLLNEFLMGQNPITVRFKDATEFVKWLIDTYSQFSSGYIRNIVKSIKAFYRFIIQEGKINEDPFFYVELPKQKRAFPKAIPTNEEVQTLIDVIPKENQRDRAIIEILYGSGIRVSELIGLKVEDINFQTGFALIHDVKSKKERMVPINDLISFSLQLYLAGERESLFKQKPFYEYPKETRVVEKSLLFVKQGGFKLCNWKVASIISTYTKLAKIKKNLTAHSFRHACATEMIKNGASIRYVQFMLGHEDITTTMIYTKLGIDDLKKAIDIFHPRGETK